MTSGVQWVKAEAVGFDGKVAKANYILGIPPVPRSCAPPLVCCEQRTARRRRSGLATDQRFPEGSWSDGEQTSKPPTAVQSTLTSSCVRRWRFIKPRHWLVNFFHTEKQLLKMLAERVGASVRHHLLVESQIAVLHTILLQSQAFFTTQMALSYTYIDKYLSAYFIRFQNYKKLFRDQTE